MKCEIVKKVRAMKRMVFSSISLNCGCSGGKGIKMLQGVDIKFLQTSRIWLP